jgi:GST-like protein
MKVALMLEEIGVPYETVPIDVLKGEQHRPEFLRINPNAKTPAIVDDGEAIFDSNAILLYLAEKSGRFLSADITASRGQLFSWLMFVASGIGPYSGQAVHFKYYAPEPKEYAVNRYAFEAERHYKILDRRLAENRYMLGDQYSLVDMAVWGWSRILPFTLGPDAWASLPNVKRHLDEINERPAAQRAIALKERFDFKTEMDEEARKHAFPQNSRLAIQPNAEAVTVRGM